MSVERRVRENADERVSIERRVREDERVSTERGR